MRGHLALAKSVRQLRHELRLRRGQDAVAAALNNHRGRCSAAARLVAEGKHVRGARGGRFAGAAHDQRAIGVAATLHDAGDACSHGT